QPLLGHGAHGPGEGPGALHLLLDRRDDVVERTVPRSLRSALQGDPLMLASLPGIARVPRDGPCDGPGLAARAEAQTALYVHVPFCAAPCPYCHFSKDRLSAAAVERWLSALEREAARRAPAAEGVVFSSVFFGGGTPSAISARHFERAW